jgi:hypothetical protein
MLVLVLATLLKPTTRVLILGQKQKKGTWMMWLILKRLIISNPNQLSYCFGIYPNYANARRLSIVYAMHDLTISYLCCWASHTYNWYRGIKISVKFYTLVLPLVQSYYVYLDRYLTIMQYRIYILLLCLR